MAVLRRTVYPHSGHPVAEDRAQDTVSSPAKERRYDAFYPVAFVNF